MTGNQISHYKIVEKLGEGGMGIVYKAQDLRLLRFVAIKLLHPDLMIDIDKRLRFIKEAQTASSLNHPNICTIHDINQENSQHFIVMEIVDGKTLREVLEERTAIPETELADIAINICEALSAVHEMGISHRDIKPENIMIANSGLVKVMDFGVAKLATEYVESIVDMERGSGWEQDYMDSVVVTNLSGFLGTVHYMSPEQAQGGAVDSRSDIFSLGVMMYELATGQKPFIGDTNLTVLTKIIKENSNVNLDSNHLSPEFKKILKKALEKEASQRYQSVNELLDDLKQLKSKESGISAITAEINPPIPRVLKSRRLRIVFSVLALSVLLTLILFTKFFRNKSDDLPLMHTSRFTSYTGNEAYPALSPDSKTVAFSWNGPDQNNIDIYIKSRDGSDPVQLTNNPIPDYNPEWSPDGHYIAFTRRFYGKPGAYDIFIIPAEGGQEKKVGFTSPMGRIPNLSWSKDGKFIFYSQWSQQDLGVAVFSVSLETQKVEQVTKPPPEVFGDFIPRVSPNGKYIGFIRQYMDERVDVVIQHFETNKIQKVVSEKTKIEDLLWGQDEDNIMYTANLDGTSALWKIDITGENKEKIVSGVNVSNPDYSKSGKCIVYNEFTVNSGIWKIDLQQPEKETLVLTSSTLKNVNPDISPDGKKMVFSSNRTGVHNIWMSNSDGTEPRQITFYDKRGKDGRAFWSPLNNKILIYFRGLDASVFDVVNEKLTDLENIGVNPIWAKDGSGFYASSHPGLILSFISNDGTNRKPLSKTPVLYTKPLGDYIYYFKHYDQREIWRIKTDGTEDEPIIQGINGLGINQWDVMSQGIYFYKWNDDTKKLYFYDFESKDINEIRDFTDAMGSITVDPEEQYLYYSKKESTRSDIILVENVYLD